MAVAGRRFLRIVGTIGVILILAILFLLPVLHHNKDFIEEVDVTDSFEDGDCTPKDLKMVNVNLTEITYDQVVAELSLKLQNKIKIGGVYSPEDCVNEKKVAIVIPFRDRWKQLNVFLRHMHPIFVKQKISYQLFIIDQTDNVPFSRAGMFNVGFDIANMINKFDCFIFHDVDLLSEDERNMYDCPTSPLHMGAYIDIYKYNVIYDECMGGAIAISYDHYMLINGHSNCYWGWGAEDDDLLVRIKEYKLQPSRVNKETSHYVMNKDEHKRINSNPKEERFKLLKKATRRIESDGLNSLKYKFLSLEYRALYTYARVDLTEQWLSSKTDSCNLKRFE